MTGTAATYTPATAAGTSHCHTKKMEWAALFISLAFPMIFLKREEKTENEKKRKRKRPPCLLYPISVREQLSLGSSWAEFAVVNPMLF